MNHDLSLYNDRSRQLLKLFEERIVFLDGAMGTMIQRYKLEEQDFRGDRFQDVKKDLKGNNDLLVFTRPDVIKEIHTAFLAAGSDIIETNTFSGTTIAQADYGLESIVQDLNRDAARLARETCEEFTKANPDRMCFVAGAIGPTNRTASLSPDVNRPEYRATSFDELKQAYKEQTLALVEGGVDLLLPETTFDTLNVKAALFGIEEVFDEIGYRLPVIVSTTITDASGRMLTGQTIGAFWNSVRHVKPTCVGLNCAMGAELLAPYVEELSRVADCHVHVYPNAGLPNPLSETGYDESPEDTSSAVAAFSDAGLVNMVGGCCGTTPEHIAAIVERCSKSKKRQAVPEESALLLSGLEPYSFPDKDAPFMMVGERCNVTGSPKFRKLVQKEDYEAALGVALQQVKTGAHVLDVCFDDGMLDGEACMTHFLNLIASEPDIAKIPVMIDSSKWSIIEAGLKCVQGKSIVNSISLKEGEERFIELAKLVKRYGAAVVVMAFDEKGQAASKDEKVRIAKRSFKILVEEVGLAPQDIIFDLNILTVGTGMEEHNNYAVDFIEAVREVKKVCPGCRTSGGVSNISFSFRGNNPVREAMHGAFLHHAREAGLDMGIVNAGMMMDYDKIDKDLLVLVEDVLLNRNPEGTEKLIEVGEAIKAGKTSSKAGAVDERMAQAMVQATGKLRDVYEKALKDGDVTILDRFIESLDKALRT
jgi:5-methyltetrahydrofolate--homocysteine methyltransferase